jgi:hypothetical protein
VRVSLISAACVTSGVAVKTAARMLALSMGRAAFRADPVTAAWYAWPGGRAVSRARCSTFYAYGQATVRQRAGR